MYMPVSSLPKNGFRIYRSTDNSLRMDALINGSAYPLKMPDDMEGFDEGYYDMDLELIEVDADAEADQPAEPPEREARDTGRTSDRGRGR